MIEWGKADPSDPLPTIQFGSFWPTIDGEKFRALYRIPAELPNESITAQLRLAGLTICRQLAAWKSRQTAANITEIDQPEADGIGALTLFFERAVFCEAKAEILRETVTVDRRKEAENSAKSGAETEEKYREFAADAIAAIRGNNRIYVELI